MGKSKVTVRLVLVLNVACRSVLPKGLIGCNGIRRVTFGCWCLSFDRFMLESFLSLHQLGFGMHPGVLSEHREKGYLKIEAHWTFRYQVSIDFQAKMNRVRQIG